MNYRGAKVNITGIVTKQQIHKAWLQLDQMKQRGQQYFKGSNCHIISAGYGDIINIVGGKEVRKEEVVEEKKMEITVPVDIICFVYDDGTETFYSGNNTLCTVTGLEVQGVYNYALLSDTPLKNTLKVNGLSLSSPFVTGTYAKWEDYAVTGPDTYPFDGALFSGSSTINLAYAIGTFFSPELSGDYYTVAGFSDSYFLIPLGQGCTYDNMTEGPGSGVYYIKNTWGDIPSGLIEQRDAINCPPVVPNPPVYEYTVPGPFADGITALPATHEVGNAIYSVNSEYPGNLISEDVELTFSYALCVLNYDLGPYWPQCNDCDSPTESGYLGDTGHIGQRRWTPVHAKVSIKSLPAFGVAADYGVISNEYDSVTVLDDEVLLVYIQGIPPVFLPYVGSSYVTTLHVQINTSVIASIEIGLNSITMKQAMIYKVEDSYVYIVSFLSGDEDIHVVVRKEKDGSYTNLSSGYNSTFKYLRVAETTIFVKKEL